MSAVTPRPAPLTKLGRTASLSLEQSVSPPLTQTAKVSWSDHRHALRACKAVAAWATAPNRRSPWEIVGSKAHPAGRQPSQSLLGRSETIQEPVATHKDPLAAVQMASRSLAALFLVILCTASLASADRLFLSKDEFAAMQQPHGRGLTAWATGGWALTAGLPPQNIWAVLPK